MNQFTAIIDPNKKKQLLNQRQWLLEETAVLQEMEICEGAKISAPEGKVITLLVNGVVKDLKPGRYLGEVVLHVSEPAASKPEGLMEMNRIICPITPAVCVEDGKITAQKSVPEAVQGGTVTDTEADGVYIAADSENFNGILIDNSAYTVKNTRIDLEGFGPNDFAGIGCAIAAVGDSEVTIEDSEVNICGVTRTAVHVAGNSRVTVRNCDLTNIAPRTDWLGSFSWQIALRGSQRLTQLAANGQVLYENCRLKSNGWGVCSIDGSDEFVKMTVKDSQLTLTGPNSHGYGVFLIGPNEMNVDGSVIDVYGYPLLVQGMEEKGVVNITNGAVLKGRRFGALIFSDDGSDINITDSAIHTGKSNLVVKSSCPIINLTNCDLKAGNGVLLQMMDTDECGMEVQNFIVPVGEVDEPIEGLDLTSVVPKKDVILNLTDLSAQGDIYNSSSNIRAYRRSIHGGMGHFHDTLVGKVEPITFDPDNMPPDMPEGFMMMKDPEERRGPQNLGVSLKNASVTGVISSAVQAYREGVTEITNENCFEMSNVTQTAAPTVNNGVVVSLDEKSSWIVTGRSYITALTLAEGAKICHPDGSPAAMTIDGTAADIKAGSYTGKIEIA